MAVTLARPEMNHPDDRCWQMFFANMFYNPYWIVLRTDGVDIIALLRPVAIKPFALTYRIAFTVLLPGNERASP